jgi:Flp pilus assembly protein TadG
VTPAHRGDVEDGNAVLEFVFLCAFFMVPLVYIVLAVFQVQATAYGITEATREAGRAFVTADSSASAYERACVAATIALRNQSVSFDCGADLHITCTGGDCTDPLSPGNTVRVEIDDDVSLPFLPRSVFGVQPAIPVASVHDEAVDEYRAKR